MLWGIPLVVPEEQGVLEAIVHPSKEQQEDLVEPVVLLQQRQHLSTNQSGPLEVPVVLHPSEVQQVGQMVVRAEATEDPVVLHPSEVQQVVRVELLGDPVLHPSEVPKVGQGVMLVDHWVVDREVRQKHREVEQKQVGPAMLVDPVDSHPSQVQREGPVE